MRAGEEGRERGVRRGERVTPPPASLVALTGVAGFHAMRHGLKNPDAKTVAVKGGAVVTVRILPSQLPAVSCALRWPPHWLPLPQGSPPYWPWSGMASSLELPARGRKLEDGWEDGWW